MIQYDILRGWNEWVGCTDPVKRGSSHGIINRRFTVIVPRSTKGRVFCRGDVRSDSSEQRTETSTKVIIKKTELSSRGFHHLQILSPYIFFNYFPRIYDYIKSVMILNNLVLRVTCPWYEWMNEWNIYCCNIQQRGMTGLCIRLHGEWCARPNKPIMSFWSAQQTNSYFMHYRILAKSTKSCEPFLSISIY